MKPWTCVNNCTGDRLKVETIEDEVGLVNVIIDGTNFGVFDNCQGDQWAFFSRRQEQLTGDHLIEIGRALNEFNTR